MRKKILIISLIVIAVSIIAVLLSYKSFRFWRADQMAQEVLEKLEIKESLDKKELKDIWEKARAAYQVNPESYLTAHTLAETYDVIQPEEAYQLWERVVEFDEAVLEDAISLIRAYGFNQQFEEIDEFIKNANADYIKNIDFKRILALIYYSAGRFDDALTLIEQDVVEGNRESVLLYYKISRITEDFILKTEAEFFLMDLIKSSPSVVELGKELRFVPNMEQREVLALIDRLEEQPESREASLLALTYRAMFPDAPEREIFREARRWFDTENDEDLLAFGRWLNNNGLSEFTPVIIPWSYALNRHDLFLVRADSLAIAGEWERLKRELSDYEIPVKKYFAHVFRMRIFLELNQPRLAEREWGKAIIEAGNDVQKLLYLSKQVKALNLNSYNKKILKRLRKIPVTMKAASMEYLKILQEEGETEMVLEELNTLHDKFPTDSTILNDLLYYRLLLNRDIKGSLVLSRELVVENPTLIGPVMTELFALLKNNQNEEALMKVRTLDFSQITLSSRWKTILVLILYANNELGLAEELRSSVKETNLLPEEVELLNRYEFFGNLENTL